MKGPKNIPASVRQRLLNRSKTDTRPFGELLQYYAMERFLFRLSQSEHVDRFVLKGALLLRAWQLPEFRGTMDIDLLGRTRNEEINIINQIRDIILVEVEPDGIIFDPDSIRVERIVEDADYEGLRVRFLGIIDSAKINMQIDIGFGDVIHPSPERLDLPIMLDYPTPRLLCYSRESAIAEKFEAMVKLGVINSRMKDFYDIWLLCRQFDFEGIKLAEAIRLTFQTRRTLIPQKVYAFEQIFIDQKQVQWVAFRKRLQQDYVPESFKEVVSVVESFITPVITSLLHEDPISLFWPACGPWS